MGGRGAAKDDHDHEKENEDEEQEQEQEHGMVMHGRAGLNVFLFFTFFADTPLLLLSFWAEAFVYRYLSLGRVQVQGI